MLASPHADAAVVLELDGRGNGNSGTAGSSPKDTFFEPPLAVGDENVDDAGDANGSAIAPSSAAVAAAATPFYTPKPSRRAWVEGSGGVSSSCSDAEGGFVSAGEEDKALSSSSPEESSTAAPSSSSSSSSSEDDR